MFEKSIGAMKTRGIDKKTDYVGPRHVKPAAVYFVASTISERRNQASVRLAHGRLLRQYVSVVVFTARLSRNAVCSY